MMTAFKPPAIALRTSRLSFRFGTVVRADPAASISALFHPPPYAAVPDDRVDGTEMHQPFYPAAPAGFDDITRALDVYLSTSGHSFFNKEITPAR